MVRCKFTLFLFVLVTGLLIACSDDEYFLETAYGCYNCSDGYLGLENRDLGLSNACIGFDKLYKRRDKVNFIAEKYHAYEIDASQKVLRETEDEYSHYFIDKTTYLSNLLYVKISGYWLFEDSTEGEIIDSIKVPYVLERYMDIADGNSVVIGLANHFVAPRVRYLMDKMGYALRVAENVALDEFAHFWGNDAAILFALDEKMTPDSIVPYLDRLREDFREDGTIEDSLELAYIADEIMEASVSRELEDRFIRVGYFIKECKENHVEKNHNPYSKYPYLVCELDRTRVPFIYILRKPRFDEDRFGECNSENNEEIKYDSLMQGFFVCQSVWTYTIGDEDFFSDHCDEIEPGAYKTERAHFYCKENGEYMTISELDYLHGICARDSLLNNASIDSAWKYNYAYYACKQSGWVQLTFRETAENYDVDIDSALIVYEENKDSIQKMLPACSWEMQTYPITEYDGFPFICGSVKKGDSKVSWLPVAYADTLYARYIDVSLPSDNVMDVLCVGDSVTVSKH